MAVTDYIRPSEWSPSSYSFIWVYLFGILVLYISWKYVGSFFDRQWTFDAQRMTRHDTSMQQRWDKVQESTAPLREEEMKDDQFRKKTHSRNVYQAETGERSSKIVCMSYLSRGNLSGLGG